MQINPTCEEFRGGSVKSASFSGTTDSNGELVTSIKYKDGITAVANHGVSVYFQIRRSSSNYVVVRATGATGQAIQSSLVEGTFYYIEQN